MFMTWRLRRMYVSNSLLVRRREIEILATDSSGWIPIGMNSVSVFRVRQAVFASRNMLHLFPVCRTTYGTLHLSIIMPSRWQ